ncbi:carbohydrate-binding module family 13 protein [Pisolithus orientalis]|uniref:carbohydrate-binding module family 13 protein n=1 Tax=Pisolithus orientalis TaxID=936130 RepID=UPI0022240664|nr:carbohydrate-binding module family 13 protein [Pisolithus orientalis]KAI5998559.1 carbohydrate-binding module family 13 protein [Pisolithus orientalis]
MACIQSGGIYALINVKAQNSCLDLSGGDNYSIIGYGYHSGPNQAWMFERQYNGNYLIRSIGSGLYLNIEGEPRDGARVVAKPTQFQWHIEDEPSFQQAIRLFVPGTNQNVDLSDHGNATPGTPVTLWGKWNGNNQLWRIESVGGVR